MAQGRAYIVGAGDFTARGLIPRPGDMLIAADGGFDSLHALGIKPQAVLGDMDSITRLPKGIARLRFPENKDLTDMALALSFAKARGYRRFRLYGATGGRLDHSLANLQTLAGLAREGLHGMIIAPRVTIYALSNGALRFPPLRAGTVVSVFCQGNEALGVTLKGLKYPLTEARLDPFTPLGVSNAATGQAFSVSVREGVLLIAIGNSPP
ncbi:MAG: thiamine diphosphokinase [Christensenellales bacterium]|jgi:thiamine pyrophosphokinase